MDGEAGWWTTSGKIGLSPLARVIGVDRQQHNRDERVDRNRGDEEKRVDTEEWSGEEIRNIIIFNNDSLGGGGVNENLVILTISNPLNIIFFYTSHSLSHHSLSTAGARRDPACVGCLASLSWLRSPLGLVRV